MLSGPTRERQKFIDRAFMSGWDSFNADNDAADDIIASPDRFLLSQSQLFDAEGGWSTFGLTMGLAGVGAAAALMLKPGMAAHFGRGQLNAMEWGMLGSATWFGGFVGHHAGVQFFGNTRSYRDHWMAYTFIKTQNRYIGGSVLTKPPMYY